MSKKEDSKTVSDAIRKMYAKMAKRAAESAISDAGRTLSMSEADKHAANAERWLRQAGAKATQWFFNVN